MTLVLGLLGIWVPRGVLLVDFSGGSVGCCGGLAVGVCGYAQLWGVC